VHRDIKPSNIIITPTGRAKLVDMGLARRFERGGEAGLTQSGMTLGTFDYISPEQATEPRQADIRSDIYSLGCTLYHMLAGQPPYPTGTALQKLLMHREKPPRNIQELNPEVPDRLAAIINRMLAKNPEDRYQTPDELLGELLSVAADLGLRCTSPEGLIWIAEPPQQPQRWLPALIWGAAAVLLLALVAGLALWPYLNRYQPQAQRQPARQRAALVHRLQGMFPEPGELATPSAETIVRPRPEAAKQAEPGIGTTVSNTPAGAKEPAAATMPPARTKPKAQPPAEQAGGTVATIVVRNLDELPEAVEQAPDGAVIELAVGQASWEVPAERPAGLAITDKHLTLRARSGSRPRLLLRGESADEQQAERTLFQLADSQLVLEGIDIELDAGGGRSALTGFQLNNASLLLRDCRLFQTGLTAGNSGGEGPSVAIVRLGPNEPELAAKGGPPVECSLSATSCLFAGGDRAILLAPGSTVRLSESILLPYRATFPAVGPESLAAEPIRLQLEHVTLFGSSQPMFDIDGHNVQVELAAVVFSWQGDSAGTLAAATEAGSLSWQESGPVLYHRVGTFLAVVSGGERMPVVESFDDWSQQCKLDPGSRTTAAMPFRMPLAEAAAAAGGSADLHWIDALRLREELLAGGEPNLGATLLAGFGPLYEPANRKLLGTLAAVLALDQRRAAQLPARPPENVPSGTAAEAQAGADHAPPAEPAGQQPASGSETRVAAAAAQPGAKPPKPASRSSAPIPPRSKPAEAESMPAAAGPQSQIVHVDAADPDAAEKLAEACQQAADGTVIELAGSGTLHEPPILLGDRRLTLRAAADADVVIELVADTLRLEGRAPSLFYLGDGSLKLIGLHFRLRPDRAVSTDRWSLVTARRADVAFENCTALVVNPDGLPASLVRLIGTASDMSDVVSESHGGSARLSLRNCFVAGPDQLLRMQPARPVRVRIENSLLAVASAVIESVGGFDSESAGTLTEAVIQHATVRAKQLMRYEAGESAPWPPHVEVNAADSLFIGRNSAAWLTLASPLNAHSLSTLLRWKGMNNSYAGMSVLLELQGSEMGTIGMDGAKYDWQRWLAEMDEVNSEHRDSIQFVAPPGPTLPLWQYCPSHFRLSEADPAVGTASDGTDRGAAADSLPTPPENK